ncbi:S8 family serine peptidase, partial [bacterium]|nr:S8 family serine peptidase [bacterium]
MNFRLIKIGLIILLFGAISAFSQEYTSNEILVKFRETQSPEQVFVHLQSAKTGLRLNKEQPLEVTALFGKLTPVSSASFFKIQISEPSNLDSLIRRLAALWDVEYAQPNYIHHIDIAPNDPLYPDQWALPLLHMETVWAQTTGTTDVLIAIIDTGIEVAHPDLQGAIHLNPGEDVNGNGTIEPTDFNGIDDDGNGFVDDICGWDFTDAPHFPDFGDYRERDNDPADEHGHGTAVAGLIGAQLNNEIGIAGMAPGCRLLNLRAGTSRGLLEEDDVAAAVVYAVHMGAQIINMSFGDEVASPLLRDVMAFAADAGVLLVASAGNSSSLSPHYPSGYAEAISVGSVTRDLYLSSFSNYGPAIDLVAPGSDLFTTNLNGEYQPFSGTSAAAPIVSAAAGLLWSKYPDWSAQEIHGRLMSTCRDLGQSGPDNLYGNGLVDPLNALDSSGSTILEIITPQSNSGTAEPAIDVTGSAAGTYFKRYFLRLFTGLEMDSPVLELEQSEQVIRGKLGRFDLTSLPDTVYTIVLTLETITGQYVEQKVVFEKDTSPPLISNVCLHSMLNYGEPAVLLEFSTDDVCAAQLKGNQESNTNKIRLDYLTRDHRILLSQSDWPD